MTPRKLLSLFLCTLSLLTFSLGQHGEGGGETSSEGVKVEAPSPCGRPLEDLHHSIEQIFGEGYTVYINCLSFDEKGLLRVGVASGQSSTGPDRRYVIECRGEVLVALPQESGSVNVTIDTTDIRNSSCVECNTSLATGACTQRCDPKCERCYGDAADCTRCTACVDPRAEMCTYENIGGETCEEHCPMYEIINTTVYNHCECRLPAYILLNEYPTPPPSNEEEEEIHCPEEEELLPGRCVTDCNSGEIVGLEGDNATGTCWACGISYCVRCDRESNECITCLEMTVLYEHECIPCPNAPIALEAVLQEEELRHEEEEKGKRTIELAVTLPVVSVLIIVFFVGMSVFAHHRYPHVSYHGHKRHRKPPTEERTASPDVSGDDQLQTSHVWRPRPTIVLR